MSTYTSDIVQPKNNSTKFQVSKVIYISTMLFTNNLATLFLQFQ